MANRIDVFLGTLAILTALTAECSGQCVTRPEILHATSYTQSIYSPYYGNLPYPPSSNCGWRIEANWKDVVRLHVTHLDLELPQGMRGCYDSITIHDGFSTYSPVMATFCTHDYLWFYSSTRYMYVNFTSDSSVERSGFILQYSSVPREQAEQHPTTRRPHWLTTHRYTTTTIENWRYPFNTLALVGGLLGALTFVLFVVAICRYCYSRRLHGQASGSAPLPHRNSHVFMVSNGAPAPHSGHTNVGFSSHGPPSYDSLQFDNSAVQPGGGGAPAPPSYSEAIMMSNILASPKPE